MMTFNFRWTKISNSYPYVLPGTAEKKKRFLDHDWLSDYYVFYLVLNVTMLSISLEALSVPLHGIMETHLPAGVFFKGCKHSSFNKGDPF